MVLKEMTSTDENAVLPVVFTGTPRKCQEYAERNGYTPRKATNPWGWYFANDKGNCLFPDIEDSILRFGGQYV